MGGYEGKIRQGLVSLKAMYCDASGSASRMGSPAHNVASFLAGCDDQLITQQSVEQITNKRDEGQ